MCQIKWKVEAAGEGWKSKATHYDTLISNSRKKVDYVTGSKRLCENQELCLCVGDNMINN